MCLNSFWNAGHRVSTTPVLRAARIVCIVRVCAGVCARARSRASFLFCSLLRSSLVPSSLFEDKRERSAPRFENALHRDFIFFPELIKGRAARASPARVTKSDSITCMCGKTIYGRGSFAAKLRCVTSLTHILN